MVRIKTLVLAEKPSVARDLASVLGQFNNRDGYLENNEYIVTWAIGHLVELAGPEDYNPDLKKWTLAALPIIPENFKLKPNPKTIKQLKIIRHLLKRPDVATLVNACDAAREGELIFRYIYYINGCNKPFNRLWLSETTPAAVKKAFAQLRPGAEMDRLARAAEARSWADWLIGINATRAFTVRHNDKYTVGRVQTPTLALIVNREWEINNFVPVPYWELYAEFTKTNGQSYSGKWFNKDRDRFDNPAAAREVSGKVDGKPAMVVSMEQKEIAEQPPFLFNLNDLQKEANKKYGFSAAKTLEIAQKLYESKKLITYPRTESRHLTKELAGTISQRLAALAAAGEYTVYAQKAQKAGSPGKRYVDDSKVTDHTALIPTETKPDMNSLSPDQERIYNLIARRFLAIFFPPAKYSQTRVITETEGETFLTTGRVELDPGWKSVYTFGREKTDRNEEKEKEEENEENTIIPDLARGEAVTAGGTQVREKKTKPPKRYTEATLLATMEGAGRLMEDSELKEAMKGHGLGTPATRAAIIEKLIKTGYLKRKQKALIPTQKGIDLINLVPDIIKSPEMTGRWEKTLAEIEAGSANPKQFMEGIINLTRQVIDLVKQQPPASRPGNNGREALGKCPLCSRDVVEFSKSYGCSGYKDGCKFAIWKETAGKKITPAQAGTLLNKGKTGIIKGFKSRTGKKFDAALIINTDGKIGFSFAK